MFLLTINKFYSLKKMDTLNTYRIIMIEMSVLLLSNLLRLLFIYFFNEMVCLKFE